MWQLGWGSLVFLISLLTVFRAPAYPLWILAVGATEWGVWFAMLSLAPVVFFKNNPSGRSGALAGLLACGLFLTPLFRAMPMAQDLPERLAFAFGPTDPLASPASPARSEPLVYADVFKGIPQVPVRESHRTFTISSGQSLRMDLYQPVSSGLLRTPGIILVHGGSWKGGRLQDVSQLTRYLAARGYLVAVPEYRLAPRWHFPAPVEDIRAAVQDLKKHAVELNLDPQRLVLIGRSAGGQIALMVAYQKPDPGIRGVIDLYGPADMVFAYSHPGNPLVLNSRALLEAYMGGPPAAFPNGYKDASPVEQVNAETVPTLIIHGALDPLVWPNHSRNLSQRLSKADRPFLYMEMPWATHGFDVTLQGPAGQLSTYTIERFIAAVTFKKRVT